jgi:methyl-accepting chemotaxis protein-like sensor
VLGAVVGELEQVFDALDGLAGGLLELAAAARTSDQPLHRDGLASLRPAILEVLAAHEGLVAGAGVITAPDLLTDAPRWLEWWWTTASGMPEALRVNLDPAAPDFYDYTAADWYATPERTRAPRVAGPYVDYACTNEYAITLSTPVCAADDVLGMAAADVLVSSLEAKVLPVLACIGRPVALASADGRVIASNSPRLAPGVRLAVQHGRRAAGPGPDLAHPLRSWVLVELDL